jgi:UDP-N-acetylmuramyl tripeptide synthase
MHPANDTPTAPLGPWAVERRTGRGTKRHPAGGLPEPGHAATVQCTHERTQRGTVTDRRSTPRVSSALMSRGRDAIAILGSRAASRLARARGYAGTSLPGLVGERLAPGITRRLAMDLGPITIVSGTNGKTTTSRLLASILAGAGHRVVANPSGANLAQAISSALTARADLTGAGLRRAGGYGVFEVDEAALPRVADEMAIAQLVLTNLFRDQLDRFGETNEVVRLWGFVLAGLPSEARVIYCADDPRLAALAASGPAGSRGYGLAGPVPSSTVGELTPEATSCPRCSATLSIEWVVVGHLGSYRCAGCGFARPEPWLAVRVVGSAGFAGQTLGFRWSDADAEQVVTVRLVGTGNAYNAAAAVAAAVGLGIEREAAVAGLADASGPFGRFETLELNGRQVVLSLVKNPASLDEVTRVGAGAAADAVLFAVNDTFADGRDVSWYWDVNPAALVAGRIFAISGSRAPDLHVRLRYQLIDDPGSELPGLIGVFERPSEGLAKVVSATPPGGTILVVATYTALLGLRGELAARGLVPAMPT